MGTVAAAAPPGHALTGVGVARRPGPPVAGPQVFFPYVRVYPRGQIQYRAEAIGRSPGLVDLMRGLSKLRPGRPLAKRLARLRWDDLAETVTGTDGMPFVTGWWTSDLGWDTARALGDALSKARWRATLAWASDRAPLSLYSAPAQRLLRREMHIRRRGASAQEVVEAALRARMLAGGLVSTERREVSDDDRLLSQIWAIDRAMLEIESDAGQAVFDKRRGPRGRDDYRECALASLEGRLPAEFTGVCPSGNYWKNLLRKAKRLRQTPSLEREKTYVPAWAVPQTVAFLDEGFVCTAHPLDIAVELARWVRTRAFLAKRWVLGGGQHSVDGRHLTTLPAHGFGLLRGHLGPALTRDAKRLLLRRRDRPASDLWAELLAAMTSPAARRRLGLPEPTEDALLSGLDLLKDAHACRPPEVGPRLWLDVDG